MQVSVVEWLSYSPNTRKVAGSSSARIKFCHNRPHYRKSKFHHHPLIIIIFFSEYFEGELTKRRAYRWLLSLDCSETEIEGQSLLQSCTI